MDARQKRIKVKIENRADYAEILKNLEFSETSETGMCEIILPSDLIWNKKNFSYLTNSSLVLDWNLVDESNNEIVREEKKPEIKVPIPEVVEPRRPKSEPIFGGPGDKFIPKEEEEKSENPVVEKEEVKDYFQDFFKEQDFTDQSMYYIIHTLFILKTTNPGINLLTGHALKTYFEGVYNKESYRQPDKSGNFIIGIFKNMYGLMGKSAKINDFTNKLCDHWLPDDLSDPGMKELDMVRKMYE